MKKLILGFVLVLMLALVFAQGQSGQQNSVSTTNSGENIQNKISSNFQIQKSENKVVMKANGNEINCSLCGNITFDGNRTRVQFSNGKNAEIKIMPNAASETALQRLRLKVCNETNNCTLELKEVGVENSTRAAYEIKVQKESKVLGLFKAKMQVQAQVDAENGEVILAKKPWWAFLATESEE